MTDAHAATDPVAEGAVAPAADAARTPHDPAAAALNRTISPVSGRLGGGMAGKLATVAALAVGCGVFVFATWRHGPPKAKVPTAPAAQVVPFQPAPAAPTGSAPTLGQPGPAAPALDSPAATSASGGAPTAGGPTPAQTAAQARAAQVQAIRGAPILAFDQADRSGPVSSRLSSEGMAKVEAATTHAPSELDQLRQGSTISLARADRLPDRNFLITAGTSLPCTLQTAMDTATPGYVSCLVGQDVYSDNGAVVLMDKGSKVLGEYRSGMRQGQARLFVLWTRAVTPAGVVIGLASPASDALGRAGFDGAIDTHFWDRFGGALLLSIVDDASSAVASRNDPNGTVTRVPSDAAAVALQNSVNIPPSLKKAQGSQVAIFVAQDLDFSSVYALKARAP